MQLWGSIGGSEAGNCCSCRAGERTWSRRMLLQLVSPPIAMMAARCVCLLPHTCRKPLCLQAASGPLSRWTTLPPLWRACTSVHISAHARRRLASTLKRCVDQATSMHDTRGHASSTLHGRRGAVPIVFACMRSTVGPVSHLAAVNGHRGGSLGIPAVDGCPLARAPSTPGTLRCMSYLSGLRRHSRGLPHAGAGDQSVMTSTQQFCFASSRQHAVLCQGRGR